MKNCFVCEIPDESKKVIAFTDETFSKVVDMLAIRKSRNLKYGNIKLSTESKETLGYHTKCYRKLNVKQNNFSVSNQASNKKRKTLNTASTAQHCNLSTMSKNLQESAPIQETPLPEAQICISPTYLDANQLEGVNEPIASHSSVLYEAVPNSSANVLKETEFHSLQENSLMNPTYTQPIESPERNRIKKCIFCCQVTKKQRFRNQNIYVCNNANIIKNTKKIAETFADVKVLNSLRNCKNFAYHQICKNKNIRKYNRLQNKNLQKQGSWHKLRKVHKNAFEALSDYILEEIVQNEHVFYLKDLFSRYKALLIEINNNYLTNFDFQTFTPQYLQRKIEKVHGSLVTIAVSDTYNKKKIVFKTGIDVKKLVNDSLFLKSAEMCKLQEVAYDIRNDVKSIIKNKLPEKLKPDDITRGECSTPEKLYEFVCCLIQGPDHRRKKSEDDSVKIRSLCQDIIYIITKGRIKPSKHLMLGLSMKSLTSSKKVLTILNKYGHSVGYTVAGELETEMTYTAFEENSLIPTGIEIDGNLSTHVAFDNFDRYVETLNGKDTLHDTVGIIYQFTPKPNLPEVTNGLVEVSNSHNENDGRSSRKRRRFEEISRDIQPYMKKITSKTTLLSLEVIKNATTQSKTTKENAIIKDLIWSISLSQIPETPMWIGFNSKTTIDRSETQTIDYLPQINMSPTSYTVVHETLKYAQKIANECGQNEIVLTYDLAIAKMAMQIQMNENPKFSNIFINLGAFHIQMAFFKAIGKFIDGSGAADILVQTEVLAEGSVNGFIDGKHFNRCKRIHPLLSGAIQTLHFEQFCLENEVDIVEDLTRIYDSPLEPNEVPVLSPLLDDIISKYRHYCNVTLKGGHGKTPQFFMQYVELINVFFRFSRSIRTSDFDLYVDSIFEIANLFFVFNQPNYARWILKYHSNLVELKIGNSGLLNDFKLGAFGIKRTAKSLARAPVDLTLEQTINADAANSLTGVNHFTNSISARQRWALSHNIRTKIISKMLTEINFEHKDDITHELAQNRIEKDKKALFEIINAFKQNINPFESTVEKEHLFHITTGRAASQETADFLLNANNTGRNQKIAFIEECSKNCERFTKPICRNNIRNFSSQCLKRFQKSKNGEKQALLKMERDVFGRLLVIALEKKIDMEVCLSYPLAPAPPSLCHYTGEMHKTDKSVLAKKLKSRIPLSEPTCADIDIIDGFYFFHLLGPSVPQTFDKISEMILRRACSTNASEVHLIFDRYLYPSIKDAEHFFRNEADPVNYNILGPLQKRTNDFHKCLKNPNFKEALVKFLAQHWVNNSMVPILGNKKVFLTLDEKCFSFVVQNQSIFKFEENDLKCSHEEADTRMIYHISKAKPHSKIVVKASDTDVLVILLGNMHKLKNFEIWLAGGNSKSRDINCINCTQLASTLGNSLCVSLPAFHAFTGCDYTACFFRKGKAKPLNLLEKNSLFQEAFAELSKVQNGNLKDSDFVMIQNFTLQMYGVKNCSNVNLARVQMFQSLYAAKNNAPGNFFKNIKNFDSSLIPPCLKSLLQKIKRTIFVSSMWANATESDCVKTKPEDYGWILKNEKCLPLWFEGEPTPLDVDDIILNDIDDETDCEQDSDDENY